MINSGLLAASTAAWISAIAVAVLVTAAVVALIAAGIYAKETKKRACALFPLEQKRDPVRQQRDDAARDDDAEEDDRHGAL